MKPGRLPLALFLVTFLPLSLLAQRDADYGTFVEHQDEAWFIAGNYWGSFLMRSNGTAAGTLPVLKAADLQAAELVNLWSAGTEVIFQSRSSQTILWKSNGTLGGSRAILTLPYDAQNPTYFATRLANANVFAVPSDSGCALYLQPFENDVMVQLGSMPKCRGLYGDGTRVFIVTEGQLWFTDGTPSGTRLSAAINAFAPVLVGTQLFFSASSPSTGTELWASDGTPEGTREVIDLTEGDSTYFLDMVPFAGKALFSAASNGTTGLWISDGTAAGTTPISTPNVKAFRLETFGTKFLFVDDLTRQIWVSDGTNAGTQALTATSRRDADQNDHVTFAAESVGNAIVFNWSDTSAGTELWSSPPALDSASMLVDIASGTLSSRPALHLKVGGLLFFTAHDRVHGTELRVTDGTAAGTRLILNHAPEATIRGTILAEDGSVIPTAQAYAVNADNLPSSVVVQTDEAGNYVIEGLLTGRWLVVATNASGYVNEVYPDIQCAGCNPRTVGGQIINVSEGSTYDGYDFTLSQGRSISGTITSASTGLPVAGVTAYVMASNGYVAASGFTDSEGHWTSRTGLVAGTYKVYSPGTTAYGPTGHPNIACGFSCNGTELVPLTVSSADLEGIDIALMQKGSLKVTVLDVENLTPIGEAGTTVRDGTTEGISQPTDANGVAQYASLNAGTYTVSAGKSGYTPLQQTVVIGSGADKEIEIRLAPNSARIAGVVYAANGTPLPGVQLELRQNDAWAGAAVTGSDGRYLIPVNNQGPFHLMAIPPAGHLVEAWGGFWCIRTTTVQRCRGEAFTLPTAEPRLFDGYDFHLDIGATVSGRVTRSAGGLPIAGALVRFVEKAVLDSGYLQFEGNYLTDANGIYSISDLPPGPYYIDGRADGFENEIYPDVHRFGDGIPPGTPPLVLALGEQRAAIDFALEQPVTLSGLVSAAATATPIAGATVYLTNLPDRSVHQTVTAGGDGRFTFTNVHSGTYQVIAGITGYYLQNYPGVDCRGRWGAYSYSCPPAAGIVITPGVVPSDAAFALNRSAVITGVVRRSQDDTPIANLPVTVETAPGSEFWLRHTVQTDANGVFTTTETLDSGPYYVFTSGAPPNHYFINEIYPGIPCAGIFCQQDQATTVPVTKGDTTAGIDFALDPLPPVVVSAITPLSGDPNQSQTITITGSGFNSRHRAHWEVVSIFPLQTQFISTTELRVIDWPAPAGQLRTLIITDGFSPVTPAPTDYFSNFLDVLSTHWAQVYVEKLFRANVTSGCTTGYFCEGATANRGQMVAFISRALAGSDAAIPVSGVVNDQPYSCTDSGVSLFADVPPDGVFCRHIHYAYGRGVTAGCAPGAFCSNESVRRDQTAAFVARALTGSDAAVPSAYADETTGREYDLEAGTRNFSDTVGALFDRHIHYLWARGIIDGCAPGLFCPTGMVTRAETAKFIANSLLP